MAKRTPSGKPVAGAQVQQANDLIGTVTFTGSVVIDMKLAIRKKRGIVAAQTDVKNFYVTGLTFMDAGGAATVHRIAAQNNGDGTFTINASKETGVAGVYATATTPCTVTWCVTLAQ